MNIAIADSHPTFIRGLRAISDSNTINVVIEALNGKDLLNKIETTSIKPSLCIIDLNMPILDGLETLIIINRKWPNIKVVIMSVYENEFTIIRALKQGACAYILKSSTIDEVSKAIIEVYEKGFYYSELVTKCLKYLIKETPPQHINLSEKEITFLKHCCTELSYSDIAKSMNVGHRTVDGYRDILFQKLGIHTRIGLVMFAIRSGIVMNLY